MDFRCNVCGTEVKDCPVENIDREVSSCPNCLSTVRFRSIVHLVSVALFGRSLPLPEFPNRPEIVGVGLSDAHCYAEPLAAKTGYTNTYFHQEPHLDICAPVTDRKSTCDFLISTEVFEHVAPPAQTAFDHAFEILKPGGALILTVPFSNDANTLEHFPDLHDYRILQFDTDYVLVNRTRDDQFTLHRDLVFHGGPGTTLEMRLYSRRALEQHLAKAGFVDVEVFDQDVPEWGILQKHKGSLPILARKPGPPLRTATAAAVQSPVSAVEATVSMQAHAPRSVDAPPSLPDPSRKPRNASPLTDIPSWILAACVALGIFGLLRSNVLAQVLWQPQLQTQALALFGAVGLASLAVLMFANRFNVRTEVALSLVLVVVAGTLCGPAATVVVLVFMASAWCLGSLVLAKGRIKHGSIPAGIAMAAGWALYAVLFSTLASVPINTTATHSLILAAPILAALARPAARSDLVQSLTDLSRTSEPPSAAYLAGLVAIVTILSFHLAMVALPERYFDAMVSHLYIPSFISAQRAWSYDAQMYAFAFMPIGGDMLYAHMFLLQGETAARLLNFAAFALACVATYRIALAACSRTVAVWAVALFVSVPLTLIESASLFVENVITYFIVSAVLLLVSRQFKIRLVDYLAIIILLAGASVVKLHGVVTALLLGGIAVILYVRQAEPAPRWVKLALITVAGGLAALWPYLYAWVRTGNPVLPLFNNVFKSRFFPPVEFVDSRWIGKLSYSVLYDATFATNNFVEAYNGALGFTFLVFLTAGIVAALLRRNRVALFCGGVGIFLVGLLSIKTQYLRYLLIFFPLLIVVVAFGLEHLRQIRYMRIPVAIAVAATLLLNVYKMPAGGWILGVSDLRACCSDNLRRQTEIGQAPERVVNRIVNDTAGPKARVFYVSNPYGGLLTGTAIYSAWYNTRDAAELASATTDEQFKALMTRIAPTHIVTATGDTTQLGKLAANYVQGHGTPVTQVGPLMLYRM